MKYTSGELYIWALQITLAATAGIILALALFGCAPAQQLGMLRAEQALEAGAEAWAERVDEEIAKCVALELPTEAERAACIAPTKAQHEAIETGTLAAVAALRAYWAAVAADADGATLAELALAVGEAVGDLPADVFAGVRSAVKP